MKRQSIPNITLAKWKKSRGAVLFVSLIMLILITLLALTASSTSVLQERMAGGLRDDQLALNGALSALRAAEVELWNSSNTTGAAAFKACGRQSLNGCFSYNAANAISTVTNFRTAKTWPSTKPAGVNEYTTIDLAAVSTAVPITAKLAAKPQYIVEDLGPQTPQNQGPGREGGVTGAGYAASPDRKNIFRVTARSKGGSDNTLRVVESTFTAKSPGG